MFPETPAGPSLQSPFGPLEQIDVVVQGQLCTLSGLINEACSDQARKNDPGKNNLHDSSDRNLPAITAEISVSYPEPTGDRGARGLQLLRHSVFLQPRSQDLLGIQNGGRAILTAEISEKTLGTRLVFLGISQNTLHLCGTHQILRFPKIHYHYHYIHVKSTRVTIHITTHSYLANYFSQRRKYLLHISRFKDMASHGSAKIPYAPLW